MQIGIDGRYIQDHFPGIGRYTYNLIDKLAKVAPEAEFLVLHNPRLRNTRHDVPKLAQNRNVQMVPLDVPTFSWREQFTLRSLAKRLPLNLLHSPYYIKPYWLPCPSVVTFYDVIPVLYPQYLPSPWARLLFRLTVRLALRSAAVVITISESAADDLLSRFGVPSDRVWVTPLAADDRFRPYGAQAIAELCQKYSLPAEYILYVGINKPHKNLVHLLEVFSLLETSAGATQEPPPLVLAGKEDPRYPQAHDMVGRLGLDDRVFFLGDVADDDLPLLYAGATLFVFPSLYEGFGLPVLEAMACGTPVICSNTSSLPEIVGSAAITLDPLDREAWAQAMEKVLSSGVLRREMQEKGLRRAKMFSWEQTARRTWQAYQEVLRA